MDCRCNASNGSCKVAANCQRRRTSRSVLLYGVEQVAPFCFTASTKSLCFASQLLECSSAQVLECWSPRCAPVVRRLVCHLSECQFLSECQLRKVPWYSSKVHQIFRVTKNPTSRRKSLVINQRTLVLRVLEYPSTLSTREYASPDNK